MFLCANPDQMHCDAVCFRRNWENDDVAMSNQPLFAFLCALVLMQLSHVSGWAKNWHSFHAIYVMICCHHYYDDVPTAMTRYRRTIAN